MCLTFKENNLTLKFDFFPRQDLGWRSSTVEQVICNHQVAGSIPVASSGSPGMSNELPLRLGAISFINRELDVAGGLLRWRARVAKGGRL